MQTTSAADLAASLDGWCPPAVTATDTVRPEPLAHLAAVLGGGPAPLPDASVPPMWHWLSFLDWPPGDVLGVDGHPHDGPFLPPIPDRRRMWAGGRLWRHRPLRTGAPATRTGRVARSTVKTGRTGAMVLVTVRYDVEQDGVTVLTEEQDHVYRSGRRKPDRPPPAASRPVRAEPWQRPVPTDERTLFALSALTANSHRIHYDAPYCRDVEGYPGLVVHGPLLVLAMLDLVRHGSDVHRSDVHGSDVHGSDVRGSDVRELDYRLVAPVFAGDAVLAVGAPAEDGTMRLRVVSTRGDHAVATAR